MVQVTKGSEHMSLDEEQHGSNTVELTSSGATWKGSEYIDIAAREQYIYTHINVCVCVYICIIFVHIFKQQMPVKNKCKEAQDNMQHVYTLQNHSSRTNEAQDRIEQVQTWEINI